MTCSICNDTGWRYVGAESERRVARCDCRNAQRSERLLKQARIPRRYQHCEFANFDILPGKYSAVMERAKLAAQKFVDHYPLEKEGLLFIGPIGVGKTHLAVSIVQALVRKGVAAVFYDYRELLKQIQDSYNDSVDATEMEVLKPAMQAEVLVLDELGTVKPSEWVWDTVSLILNKRYNDGSTTIITTNLPDLPARDGAGSDDVRSTAAARRAGSEPTLGDRITERMRSRLHEMCRTVEMRGEDFRQTFKKATFNPL
jgi:DNA replication protein DnaC